MGSRLCRCVEMELIFQFLWPIHESRMKWKELTYLPNNVFAVRNRVHSSQQLEEYYTKAVNIALVRELVG